MTTEVIIKQESTNETKLEVNNEITTIPVEPILQIEEKPVSSQEEAQPTSRDIPHKVYIYPPDKNDEVTNDLKCKLCAAIAAKETSLLTISIQSKFFQEQKMLIRGHSYNCFLDGVKTIDDLANFATTLDYQVDERQIVSKQMLYVFRTPTDYTAFSDQVTFEELFWENKAKYIRADKRHKLNMRRVVSCPAHYILSRDLGQKTRKIDFVSFILNSKSELVRWKPGIFVDTLKEEEQSGWVMIL